MEIAIASGKGGTGKTTVAVSLFHFFEQYFNSKVQLVDCDVEEPNDALFFSELNVSQQKEMYQYIPQIDTNLCLFCRKCVDWCRFNAITMVASRKFAQVDNTLCHSCGACVVACKNQAIIEKPNYLGKITKYITKNGGLVNEGRLNIGSAMGALLINKLKIETKNDELITLIDAPPGTSCPVVETVADVDYVILVAEPTPFGLHDLKITVELMEELKKPFGVIVNKANLGSKEIYNFLSEKKIKLLGEIPFSKEYATNYYAAELLENIPLQMESGYKNIIQNLKEEINRNNLDFLG